MGSYLCRTLHTYTPWAQEAKQTKQNLAFTAKEVTAAGL